MINLHISQIIQRDLAKVKEELRQYQDQDSIWKVIPGTANSGGNLALHIAGNLRHFIGAVIGDTGYVREREVEFSQKDVDVTILYALIDTTIAEIAPVLDNIGTAALTA